MTFINGMQTIGERYASENNKLNATIKTKLKRRKKGNHIKSMIRYKLNSTIIMIVMVKGVIVQGVTNAYKNRYWATLFFFHLKNGIYVHDINTFMQFFTYFKKYILMPVRRQFFSIQLLPIN